MPAIVPSPLGLYSPIRASTPGDTTSSSLPDISLSRGTVSPLPVRRGYDQDDKAAEDTAGLGLTETIPIPTTPGWQTEELAEEWVEQPSTEDIQKEEGRKRDGGDGETDTLARSVEPTGAVTATVTQAMDMSLASASTVRIEIIPPRASLSPTGNASSSRSAVSSSSTPVAGTFVENPDASMPAIAPWTPLRPDGSPKKDGKREMTRGLFSPSKLEALFQPPTPPDDRRNVAGDEKKRSDGPPSTPSPRDRHRPSKSFSKSPPSGAFTFAVPPDAHRASPAFHIDGATASKDSQSGSSNGDGDGDRKEEGTRAMKLFQLDYDSFTRERMSEIVANLTPRNARARGRRGGRIRGRSDAGTKARLGAFAGSVDDEEEEDRERIRERKRIKLTPDLDGEEEEMSLDVTDDGCLDAEIGGAPRVRGLAEETESEGGSGWEDDPSSDDDAHRPLASSTPIPFSPQDEDRRGDAAQPQRDYVKDSALVMAQIRGMGRTSSWSWGADSKDSGDDVRGSKAARPADGSRARQNYAPARDPNVVHVEGEDGEREEEATDLMRKSRRKVPASSADGSREGRRSETEAEGDDGRRPVLPAPMLSPVAKRDRLTRMGADGGFDQTSHVDGDGSAAGFQQRRKRVESPRRVLRRLSAASEVELELAQEYEKEWEEDGARTGELLEPGARVDDAAQDGASRLQAQVRRDGARPAETGSRVDSDRYRDLPPPRSRPYPLPLPVATIHPPSPKPKILAVDNGRASRGDDGKHDLHAPSSPTKRHFHTQPARSAQRHRQPVSVRQMVEQSESRYQAQAGETGAVQAREERVAAMGLGRPGQSRLTVPNTLGPSGSSTTSRSRPSGSGSTSDFSQRGASGSTAPTSVAGFSTERQYTGSSISPYFSDAAHAPQPAHPDTLSPRFRMTTLTPNDVQNEIAALVGENHYFDPAKQRWVRRRGGATDGKRAGVGESGQGSGNATEDDSEDPFRGIPSLEHSGQAASQASHPEVRMEPVRMHGRERLFSVQGEKGEKDGAVGDADYISNRDKGADHSDGEVEAERYGRDRPAASRDRQSKVQPLTETGVKAALLSVDKVSSDEAQILVEKRERPNDGTRRLASTKQTSAVISQRESSRSTSTRDGGGAAVSPDALGKGPRPLQRPKFTPVSALKTSPSITKTNGKLFAGSEESNVGSSSLRTPLKRPNVKEPRSVSFSDGRLDGKMVSLDIVEDDGAADTSEEVEERTFMNHAEGSAVSLRTKGIMNALDALGDLTLDDNETPSKNSSARSLPFSLSQARANASLNSGGGSVLVPRSRSRASIRSKDDPNATFLTDCSFGVSHDRLLEVITDIVPWEPDWEGLKSINLSGKGVESLIKLKEFLPSLQELKAHDNVISYVTGVPDGVRRLFVASNRLTSVTSFHHLLNIEELDISGNHIDSLQQLACLRRLRDLKADNNRVTDIDGIAKLDELVKLSLRGNCMGQIDMALVEWPRLEALHLGHNQINSVKGLEKLRSLAWLNLNHNRLTALRVTATMRRLRVLKISDNPKLEQMDCRPFPSLRVFYADGCSLSEVRNLDKLPKLEDFSVREQVGGQIPWQDLELRDTKRLYLTGNHFPVGFPFTTERLLNLTYLELAACQLTRLPDDLHEVVPNIRSLNLDYNLFSTLPRLSELTRLRRFSAVGCRLKGSNTVARALRNLRELEVLDIRMNPCTLGFYPPVVLSTATEARSGADTRFKSAHQSTAIKVPVPDPAVFNPSQHRPDPSSGPTPISDDVTNPLREYEEARRKGYGKDDPPTGSDAASLFLVADKRFRNTLPPSFLRKRLLHRGLLIMACPAVLWLDGLEVTVEEAEETEGFVKKVLRGSGGDGDAGRGTAHSS